MKKFHVLIVSLVMLVLMLNVPAAFGQSAPPPPTYAESSKSSDTVADPSGISSPKSKVQSPRSAESEETADGRTDQQIINACAATAADLKSTRALVTGLETENRLLYERLETEKRTNSTLLQLNEARRAEASSLRETVAAKNEALAAKDQVIQSQDKLVATLQKKKSSPLKRLADVLTGVGLAALFAL